MKTTNYMIKFLFFLNVLVCNSYAFSQTPYEMFLESHKLFDQRVKLKCDYTKRSQHHFSVRAQGLTVFEDLTLKRSFVIEDHGVFTVEVKQDRSNRLQVKLQSEDISDFNYAFEARTRTHFFWLLNKSQLMQGLYCVVKGTQELDVPLKSHNHINLHPHRMYDIFQTLDVALHFHDPRYHHLVLTDYRFSNENANLFHFFKTGELKVRSPLFRRERSYRTDLEEIPKDALVMTSPSGHNDFMFDSSVSSQLEILYTGGNHNYCMLNNVKSLFEALFKQRKVKTLHIFYDTKNITLQRDGLYETLSVDEDILRGAQLNLSMLIDQGLFDMKTYHIEYLHILKQNIMSYARLFSEVSLYYDNEKHMLQGLNQEHGVHFEIHLHYLK